MHQLPCKPSVGCLPLILRVAYVCRWNKYLAKFVNSLCKHLNKRLAKEAASPGQMSNGSVNGISSSGRQQLSTETQRRLAQVILRMADKAQYSKVSHVVQSLSRDNISVVWLTAKTAFDALPVICLHPHTAMSNRLCVSVWHIDHVRAPCLSTISEQS